MTEDQHSSEETSRPAPDVREPWVAPVLTDLGSFADLTRLNVSGPNLDSEGFST